jgi:hypothetical protein
MKLHGIIRDVCALIALIYLLVVAIDECNAASASVVKPAGIVSIVNEGCDGPIYVSFDARAPEFLREVSRAAMRYWNWEVSHVPSIRYQTLFWEVPNLRSANITISVDNLKNQAGVYKYLSPTFGCPQGKINIDYEALNYSMASLQSLIRHELGHVLGLGHTATVDPEFGGHWSVSDVMNPSLTPFEKEIREASPKHLRLLWQTTKPLWPVLSPLAE